MTLNKTFIEKFYHKQIDCLLDETPIQIIEEHHDGRLTNLDFESPSKSENTKPASQQELTLLQKIKIELAEVEGFQYVQNMQYSIHSAIGVTDLLEDEFSDQVLLSQVNIKLKLRGDRKQVLLEVVMPEEFPQKSIKIDIIEQFGMKRN